MGIMRSEDNQCCCRGFNKSCVRVVRIDIAAAMNSVKLGGWCGNIYARTNYKGVLTGAEEFGMHFWFDAAR